MIQTLDIPRSLPSPIPSAGRFGTAQSNVLDLSTSLGVFLSLRRIKFSSFMCLLAPILFQAYSFFQPLTSLTELLRSDSLADALRLSLSRTALQIFRLLLSPVFLARRAPCSLPISAFSSKIEGDLENLILL